MFAIATLHLCQYVWQANIRQCYHGRVIVERDFLQPTKILLMRYMRNAFFRHTSCELFHCYFIVAVSEHSKLCIKNAVQYLSDFSNVNSGFNFSHRGLASQVRY